MATRGECSDNSKTSHFWRKLWLLKIQRKTTVFIWRLFNNYLPVAENLRRRGCDSLKVCWYCDYLEESVSRVFHNCWWAKALWSKLGVQIPDNHEATCNIGDWLWYSFLNSSGRTLITICYGASTIWYCRNSLAHDKEGMTIDTAVSHTNIRIDNFLRPEFKFMISEEKGTSEWCAPTGRLSK